MPLQCDGIKPKGMHWRTLERLKAEHDGLVGEYLVGVASRFGWLDDLKPESVSQNRWVTSLTRTAI